MGDEHFIRYDGILLQCRQVAQKECQLLRAFST